MFLYLNEFRFVCIRSRIGFDFVKKRHLPLNFESKCLLGFYSIKFTGQEINLLFQELELLSQFFDMIFELLFHS